jgi:hypothetical protein
LLLLEYLASYRQLERSHWARSPSEMQRKEVMRDLASTN